MTDYEAVYDEAYEQASTGGRDTMQACMQRYQIALAAVVAAAKKEAWEEGHSQAIANIAWPHERKGNPYRTPSGNQPESEDEQYLDCGFCGFGDHDTAGHEDTLAVAHTTDLREQSKHYAVKAMPDGVGE